MMHAKLIDQKNLTTQLKGYAGMTYPAIVKGKLLVVEMGPEDFHLIDNDIANWASPANQDQANRKIFEDEHYYGHVKTNEQLQSLIRDGWEEGSQRILDLATELRDLIPTPMGPRRKLKWSEQGDSIDMARVYGGQLDQAWRSHPRQRERAPRVISIDADVGHNCNVSAEELMWAGAAAVALTDALETAGYRVELFSTSASTIRGGKGVALTRMVAKRAYEPLNLTLAASLVSLPATFRWYHLMSWLKHPVDIGMGFGQATAVQEPLDAAVLEGTLAGAEMTISESLSRDSAIAECTAAIERLEQEQDSGRGSMV